ncbi:MAG: 2-hydroxy-3-oxopropionate reductase [Moraxellaceae bacterium]|jgi:3-hydroxyisobutyrate dehydrogenase|nr:2-hydroxy-3-oxopropionate reductase [Moraxellaceae bacterium]
MTRIGFIGIGLMGLPMCRRLLAAGYPLTVWNRSPDKCAPLVAAGATQATSPAALARACEVIMVCVADTAAVEDVFGRAEGLATGLGPGKTVIDFSSIDPAVTRVLSGATRAAGAHWLDTPVSGGVVGAEAGSLVIMAGGEAEALDPLRPLLAHLSQRVTHMGASGAGQVTKICNQLIVAANAALIAEAVALAERAGVDARRLAPALAGGFADSKPFQLLAPRMSARQFEPVQWRVRTLLKDLDMAGALAAQCGSPAPLAAQAASLMRTHGAHGFLDQDLSTLIHLFTGAPAGDPRAGTTGLREDLTDITAGP